LRELLRIVVARWERGRKEKFIAISEKDNHQREKMCEVRERNSSADTKLLNEK